MDRVSKKLKILTLILLLAISGCAPALETMIIGHSMVSTDGTYRNNPGAQNIWGPKEAEK
jgi:hypothetical protein